MTQVILMAPTVQLSPALSYNRHPTKPQQSPTKTTFVSCFVKLHNFAEFRSVSFRVTEWTLLKYSEPHGMSTLFRGITKTVPSLFRGIFSEQNSDGNPI